MKAIDEYDIQRSFEVLDEDKSNRITLKNFHTMFLGLGYQPKQLTIQQLREKVAAAIDVRRDRSDGACNAEDAELFDAEISGTESFVPLSLVLEILAQHSRDRTDEINRCFQLMDSSNKGYVTAKDLKRLSEVVGEQMNEAEANALISGEWGPDTFSKMLFSPPSP